MDRDIQILRFMAAPGYRPMKQHELARALGIGVNSKEQRVDLRQVLRSLEYSGKIVRLRKNRWILPSTSNRMEGILKMMARGGGGGVFIADQGDGSEIYISNRNRSTALPNDKVLIEILPSVPSFRQRERKRAGSCRTEGYVVQVLERSTDRAVGLLKYKPRHACVIPDAPGFRHEIHIKETKNIPKNHKVLVKLNEWTDPLSPLTGCILEDLGHAEDPGVDIDSLLLGAGIREKFPEEALAEAERLSEEMIVEKMAGRRDLRQKVTFSIDPETAQDHDDAISLEPHPEGGWLLGVHIADVSAYVQPGSSIDREAFKRGNSIYLVDRTVMMLPKELTANICSLTPRKDHLSHTVQIHMSETGETLAWKTFPSVIHSKAKLTYTQAQRFIDGRDDHGVSESVAQQLERLWSLVQKVRARRIENGSVEINTPEIEIKLDDGGKVEKITPRSDSKEAYWLIEECMLLANRVVAERLLEAAGPFICRVHEAPDKEQWAAMGMELQALGIPILPETRQDINRAVKLGKNTVMEHAVGLVILRNFKRAEYSVTQTGHFGLAFNDYTHFTSPIRRYADLLVHRLLKAVEKGAVPAISGEQLRNIARHCTDMEKKADELEKKSIEKKRVEYYAALLKTAGSLTFTGYITAIKKKGMIIELPDSHQRGLAAFSSITSEWLEADKSMTRVCAASGKMRYTIGQKMKVILVKVDTERGFVDFVPEEEIVRCRQPHPSLTMHAGKYRMRRGRRRRKNRK